MKTIKYLIVLLTVSCLYASCSKNFLTEYPEGNLNTGIFFKSSEDFEQALTGAYVPLRDIANEAYLMDECRSDNARYFYYVRDRGNNKTEQMTNYMVNTDNGIVLNRYQNNYVGISRANVILDRIQNISFEMADSAKNQIIGEAKALRAHYYFDLVRKFGGVPLFLHEVKSPDGAYKARASADEIYEQIILDLKDAVSLLQNPSLSLDDAGRINKGMASTELGRVYLMRKKYHEAIPYLESVTQMGYKLLTNYRDVFDPSNEGNKEIIFAVQYKSGTSGQGSEFVYDFTPKVPNTGPILGTDFNNDQGGWDVPTQNLIDIFDPVDSRFDASIGVFEADIASNLDFMVTSNSLKSIVGFTPTPGKGVRYFARKFYYPPYPEKGLKTDQNWPIYRYSGVLLMLAECYNESSQDRDPGKSLLYLNQVRERAFGDGSHDITTTNQNDLRLIIAKERRRELCFENKRSDDLIRTDQLVPVMNAYGDALKQKFSYLLPQTYTLTQNDLLFPIPFQEMALNDKLTQNPGY